MHVGMGIGERGWGNSWNFEIHYKFQLEAMLYYP